MKTAEIKYQGNKTVIHWMDKWIEQTVPKRETQMVSDYL